MQVRKKFSSWNAVASLGVSLFSVLCLGHAFAAGVPPQVRLWGRIVSGHVGLPGMDSRLIFTLKSYPGNIKWISIEPNNSVTLTIDEAWAFNGELSHRTSIVEFKSLGEFNQALVDPTNALSIESVDRFRAQHFYGDVVELSLPDDGRLVHATLIEAPPGEARVAWQARNQELLRNDDNLAICEGYLRRALGTRYSDIR